MSPTPSSLIIMAFNSNAQRSNNTNERSQSWKAAGFLNLYLPSANGGRRKLGAIALRQNNTNENALFEALAKDPELVETIRDRLVIEFRSAEPEEGSGFDLG